jgi:hypothetical protein
MISIEKVINYKVALLFKIYNFIFCLNRRLFKKIKFYYM